MDDFIPYIDAKNTSRSENVIFFCRLGSNFLGKNDKKVKFGKNVRLGSKSMKKVFGRNFCHFRAPWDPTKYQKSQKTVFFDVLGSPSAKIGLFWSEISARPLLPLFCQKTKFQVPSTPRDFKRTLGSLKLIFFDFSCILG